MKSRLGATVAAVGVALTACSAGPPAAPTITLQLSGDPGAAGTSMNSVPPNTPWLFGAMEVCLSGQGSVSLTDVSLVKPTGSIRLVGWGVHPGASLDGSFAGSISSVPSLSHGPVITPCSTENATNSNTTALDVVVESTDEASTTASGFNLNYRSGGRSRTLYMPFYLAVCAAKTCPGLVIPKSS